MRCKQGDMAYVTGWPENDGVVVQCREVVPAGTDHIDSRLGPLWLTDHAFIYYAFGDSSTRSINYCPDELLRSLPELGDEDERDEEITKHKELENV